MKVEKIVLVRDPRTADLHFLEAQPTELVERMSSEEWKNTIDSINNAIKDRITLKSIFKNLSLFMLIFSQPEKEHKIDQVIKETNERFKERGVYFCNPRSLQFQELEVILKTI